MNAPAESGRFRKTIAVSGDQGDDQANLQECRNKLELVADKVVIACDQLGEVIASVQQSGNTESLMQLLPMLQNLWELRWELFVNAGDVSAEPSMRRAVACYPDEEAGAAQ